MADKTERPTQEEILQALRTIKAVCVSYPAEYCNKEEKEQNAQKNKIYRNLLISGFVAGGVLLLACVFIPSQDTLIAMKVAELATKENAAITLDAIKDIVDYVLSAIEKVREV